LPKIKDGAFVTGFFIEGAYWNFITSQLEQTKPLQNINKLPIILFQPIDKLVQPDNNRTYLKAPIFINSLRNSVPNFEGFVMEIPLPYNNNEYSTDFFIKKGTAVLLNSLE
jgi:hypothetical protein